MIRYENKQANIWFNVAEGEFDHVEYGHWTESRRSGAMVHTTNYYKMTATAIFFTDGRSYILNGRKDVPFPKGTKVTIRENKLGNRKIVLAWQDYRCPRPPEAK
jgi:hypothetical protein